MSLFGESLPYEDDTAASLIRKSGFPPEKNYVQMPQSYVCPCCSEFNEAQERERLVRAARDEKEAEKRKLLQLDVFDERAKPLPSAQHRRKLYKRVEEEEVPYEPETVPPPPATLDELRRSKKEEVPPAKLIVTVHYGKNLEAQPVDPLSVIVRCGAFEGQTAKVPRGKGSLTTWDELFEFPYANPEENLEVLVINDSLPESDDHLLGGVVVPSDALHDKTRGDEESLPVCNESDMKSAFDQMKEGPNGAIVVSWYVSQNGEEPTDDAAEAMNLSTPLECVFVAHRVFQYADNGSEPFPQGVLCVLRDTDDNCSESVLYLPGSNLEPSLSPYCEKEGFHYLPENASQVMQLNTEKKLGHILVCVPKKENTTEAEEEELLVVGAVPVDFSKLHRKGNVVLFIESKSKDDAVWGEISLEWLNTSQDAEKKPAAIDVDKESLFVNVVRGLNLINRDGQPVSEAYVSVAAGEMEGFTVMAPNVAEGGDDTHVITWNQEIRFMDVDPKEENLEVVAFENGNPISTGFAYLKPEEDEAVVVVQMHDMYKEQEERGEIIVNFKRLHVNDGGATRALESESEQNAAEDSDREAAEEEAEHATSQEPESAVDSDKESEEAQEEQHENDEEEAAAEEAQDEEEEQEEAQDRALEDDQQQQEEEAEEEENDTHEDGDDEESEKESAAAAEEEEEEKQEDSAHEEEKEEEEAHHSDEEQDNQDDHESDAEEEKQEESAEHNEEEEEENHSEEQNQAEEEDDDHNRASEDENKENKEDEEDKENDEDSEDHQDRDASEEEKHEEPAEEGDDNQHDGEDEDQDGNDDKEQHDDDDQQEEDQESHKGETNDNEEEEGAADQNDADENEDAAGDAQEAEEGEAGGSDGAEEDAAEPKEPQQDGLDQASEGKPESDYQPDDKAVSPSPAPQPRRSSKPVWSDSRKSRGYQQPWYPAGRPNNDSHLPYEKTQRSEKSKENIKELERRRERLEEESMRRGSTPRSSLSTPH